VFDLTVLPIHRINSQEQTTFPGLSVVLPPHRAARGRSQDRLGILLTLTGDNPISAEGQNQILAHLSQTYYKTTGSVTYVMRLVADVLNQYLLKRNLSHAGAKQQSLGFFTIVVLREKTLYVAHSGPNQCYLFINASNIKEFHDIPAAGRGLGCSRTTILRYFQTDLHGGEILLIGSRAPQNWSADSLRSEGGLNLDNLRRRLISQTNDDLYAVLLQFQAGTGKLITLRPREPVQVSGAQRPAASQASQTETDRNTSTVELDNIPVDQIISPEQVIQATQASPMNAPIKSGPDSPVHHTTTTAPPVTPHVKNPPPIPPTSTPISLKPPQFAASVSTPTPKKSGKQSLAGNVIQALLPVQQYLREAWEHIRHSLFVLLKRMLPDSNELPFTFSPMVMAFVAIAVPLIVVTISSVVYLQRGRSAQHQYYYTMAETAAVGTLNQPDRAELHKAWEQTLYWLDKAESYQITTQSIALRKQAQNALDDLDGILRLGFQQAIAGGLSNTMKISKMAATTSELYLLNSSRGNILRAILTGRGYEIDTSFICESGIYENISIGPIIDMALMPKGNELDASVMGIDSNGNLIFCITGKSPQPDMLAPPDNGWGNIQRISLSNDSLYMLDPAANAVWVYKGDGINFADRPQMYLYKVLPSLKDMVDMMVNDGDLYLLHSDGHLVKCIAGNVREAQSRCIDPALYIAPIYGNSSGLATLPDIKFTRMLLTSPPDPSIYFLEPTKQAIYQFSWQLSLQKQLKFQTELANTLRSSTATAFTFSPNRTVFMAINNQVYYAIIP
jgi:hypothetical protein